MSTTTLKKTPLIALHKAHNATIVGFAGYSMPLKYAKLGVLKEHLHTRAEVGLFDVSHMGQISFIGKDAARFVEWATPCDLSRLANGSQSLSFLLNDKGGVKDDCIVTRWESKIGIVLNAGCKEKDVMHLKHLMSEFNGDVTLVPHDDKALVALQGPKAAEVLASLGVEDLHKMPFMTARENVSIQDIPVNIYRCGYTGEDGFEISANALQAEKLVNLLLDPEKNVELIGLAARDSLRVEAGMCLYGNELSEDINPVAAKLMWCISSRRQREGGFLGHEALMNFKANQKNGAVPKLRVGLLSPTGPVARSGTPVLTEDGNPIGVVTSGVPSPSLGSHNVAMAYVNRDCSTAGHKVQLKIRDRQVPAEVVPTAFIPTKYYKPVVS